ncbi:MAG: 30S ribosome-binding factor RbfA [candidate division Zixibacteria bacterium]|nr:30S ribosome-binding factor RbfA [candidate division Zixibacteria bacterium]
MRSFKRSVRVADQIQRDVSEIISDLLRDEINLMVTVSKVELTNDLRYGKIFYTVLGGDTEKERAEEFFERTVVSIKTELAHRIRIRRVPEISIHFDTSLVEGLRVATLIDKVMSESKKDEEQSGEEE